MDDPQAFNLILADELRHVYEQATSKPEPEAPPRVREETVVIERKSFTTSTTFPIHDNDRSFPVHGPGTVESILLVSDTGDYDITVAVDIGDVDGVGPDATYIDDSYSTLSELSAELEGVSAMTSNEGNEVLSIGPIDFIDNVKAWVQPTAEVTFHRQRAVVNVERTM